MVTQHRILNGSNTHEDCIVTDAQTMSKAKKRSWFQVHLSTAVVLVGVMGIILGQKVDFFLRASRTEHLHRTPESCMYSAPVE